MNADETNTNEHDVNIDSVLDSVRQRVRKQNTLQWATIGLVVGCFSATVLAIISAAVTPVAWVWLPITMIACAVIGAIGGFLVPAPASLAARIVDSYYLMKDRAITAIEFQKDDDPVRRLQVADAKKHLGQVRSKDCVRIEANRSALATAGTLAALAAGIFMFVGIQPIQAIDATPVSLAIDQADDLRETMLKEIEELKEESPELEELSEELEELVEKLESESIDEHDMMATLSEMEQAISEAREAMQLEITDAQMKGLAQALTPSEMMKMAAAAMESGEYEKASEKLEAIDPSKLNDKERRAVADNLKKYLAKLDPGQKGELSNAAQEMQEGLEKKNDSKCKSGMCKLAKLCKKQGNCKKIGECMACQLNKLAQCKGQCRGACKSASNKVAKSNTPSQKWGKGATGKPNDGEATKLNSARKQENISGTQGDGPSESEVIEAPEGEQDAARQYAKKYTKFKSQAEAVLDTEPLPLGHRETVRQYFENIRPSNEDATE